MDLSCRQLARLVLTLSSICMVCGGCAPQAESEVVIFTALDQEYAAPIFAAFHRSSGGAISPNAKFDVESTTADDLVKHIINEQGQAAADVYWNNDILLTIALQHEGLLASHPWKVETGYPAEMCAKDGSWCGFAARGRVLLVNTDQLPDPSDYPSRVDELAAPQWKANCAIAHPLVGTMATHAAVIRQIKGEEAARQWFTEVAGNAVVLPTNRAVAIAVATGQVAWGLTDTNDAIIEKEDKRPVVIVYPDQASEDAGTLRIPNTVAILKNAAHPIAAAKLVDYLVTPHTEDRLAMGESAQMPISRFAQHRSRVLPDGPVRWMKVDFEAAATEWESLASELNAIFK